LAPWALKMLVSVPASLQESEKFELLVVSCSEPLIEWVSASVKLSTDVVTVSVTLIVP
jgi:hypothetical protein